MGMPVQPPTDDHRDDRRPLYVWRGRTTSQRWQWAIMVLVVLVAVSLATAFHR